MKLLRLLPMVVLLATASAHAEAVGVEAYTSSVALATGDVTVLTPDKTHALGAGAPTVTLGGRKYLVREARSEAGPTSFASEIILEERDLKSGALLRKWSLAKTRGFHDEARFELRELQPGTLRVTTHFLTFM